MSIFRLNCALLAILTVSPFISVRSVHAEGSSQNQNSESGVLTGQLTGKGENWIEVKVDGRDGIDRFRPQWVGGMPQQGGGPDKKVLEQIRKLVVPSRVRVAWKISEGPRVVAVEMIEKPTEAPKPPAASGKARGIVVAKGEKWIDIRTEDVTRRFIPRWIGGMPKNGGGLDKNMLKLISLAPVGARVRYEWFFEEHLRITALGPDEERRQ